MNQTFSIRSFYGGFSDGDRTGPFASFRNAKRLDIFSKPDSVKILPAPTKVSGTTVVDLIKWMIVVGTNLYHYGDAGKLYSCTNAGASWALLGTLTTSHGNGMGYFKTDDYIYLAKDQVISRYGPIGGTPALTQDYFTDGTLDLDQSLDTSGQTYTLPTTINEGATHRQTFKPTKDSIRTIEVLVAAKGTGDWTLTVHDPANTVVGTKTLTNANVSVGDQKFTFASDLRPIVGLNYHFHLTSTVVDGTVTTTTASDLETVDYHEYFGVLISDTSYHPVATIQDMIVFGNGPYLATWNGITYDPNAIQLPLGLKVRSLIRGKEFLEIGTWSGAAITDNDEGYKFYWDGVSPVFNFFSELGFGAVNAQAVMGGKTYMVAGSTSVLYESEGVEDPEPVKKIPDIGTGKYVEIYPGAMDVWDGLLHIGVAGGGDSSTVLRGIWQYGTKNRLYPAALNYGYTCSDNTTETSTNVTIGALKGVGRKLFFSWKNSTTYGVDMVSATGTPAGTGEYEALVFDDGRPCHLKKPLRIVANHKSLIGVNEGITLKYKSDRASSFTSGSINRTDASLVTELPLSLQGKFYELEVGVTLTSYGVTTPEVTSLSFEFDDLISEKKVGGNF